MDARRMRLRAAVWFEQGVECICVLLGVRKRCMSLRAAALCIGSLNHFRAMLKGENWF